MEENDIPDFANAVDVVDTGDAISTVDIPDFSTAIDVATEPKPLKGLIASIAPEKVEEEKNKFIQNRMNHISGSGDFKANMQKQFELEWELGQKPLSYATKAMVDATLPLAGGGAVATGLALKSAVPVAKFAASIGAFMGMDRFINLRRYVEHNFPDTTAPVKEVVGFVDFATKAFAVGVGFKLSKIVKQRIMDMGKPKNVNISPEEITKIQNSPNLLPEEKKALLKDLGITQDHIEASKNGALPINVSVDKIVDIVDKPYWEKTKAELLLGEKYGKAETSVNPESEVVTPKQPLIEKIKSLQKEKDLSNITVSQLKKFIGIENIKQAETPQLEKLQSFLKDLKGGDKFLSEKQASGLKDIIKELPNPEITPKRIIFDKFGEKEEIMNKGIVGKIPNEGIPTVDIKEGHPIIARIVEKGSEVLTKADNIKDTVNRELDVLLTKAEKSRVKSLPLGEKINRKLLPQNKEIFEALGGNKVKLTPEETIAKDYLKNLFEKARKDLKLEKYRKNYITHLEKDLTEKILTDGVFEAVKSVFGVQKEPNIPIDIMLELDNIIGSEKFFRFALERKGGIDPSTNIRRIVNQYVSMLETKKALDSILPEGQAVVKTLLKGKSAIWMRDYLKNLKGRALDFDFRNGKAAWLAKGADAIIDAGYIKLLGLNWKSALKNVVAGEVNSWIYQDFDTYLMGKKRFISNPKKAYKLAKDYNILDGTYADFAQKGLGSLKKVQDFMMVGQKVGEVEIRTSILAGMVTEKEWQSGEISSKHYNEIKDTIAITQGVFSKADSPLWVQTWYGRALLQMNRWRITNAMLLRRLTNDAVKDVKAGNYNTQATTRFGKAWVAYGIGMYTSYQLALAGYNTAANIVENMAQTIDGVVSLFSKGELIKMYKENPTLQLWDEISNTMMDLAAFAKVPGAKQARGEGIEDTYIAPIKTIEDITEGLPF